MNRLSLKNVRMLQTTALVASALLLISGCAGAPAADPSSTASSSSAGSVSASPTPSPTPTPTPSYKPASAEGPAENVAVPVMPAVAKEHTEEGLKAFIEYYFELIDYSYESISLDVITPYTNKNCGSCSAIARNIRDNQKNGVWIVGGKHSIDLIYVDMSKRALDYKFANVKFQQAPSKNYSAPGTVDEEFGLTSDIRWQMNFKATNNGWIVVDMGAPKS